MTRGDCREAILLSVETQRPSGMTVSSDLSLLVLVAVPYFRMLSSLSE